MNQKALINALVVIIVVLVAGVVYFAFFNKPVVSPVVGPSPTNTSQQSVSPTKSVLVSPTPVPTVSQQARPKITIISPPGLIPQNEIITIIGSGFTQTGNIISVGNENTIPNYRSRNKEFILPSSNNGTKIIFIPEQYGIIADGQQATGGGWLTVINPITGLDSNSVQLNVGRTRAVKTYQAKGFTFQYDPSADVKTGLNGSASDLYSVYKVGEVVEMIKLYSLEISDYTKYCGSVEVQSTILQGKNFLYCKSTGDPATTYFYKDKGKTLIINTQAGAGNGRPYSYILPQSVEINNFCSNGATNYPHCNADLPL